MNPTWNRRTFLTSIGLTTAAAALPSPFLTANEAAASTPSIGPQLAFLSYAHYDRGSGGIATYRVEDGRWTHLPPFWPGPHAHALVPHPTLPILYTAGKPSVYDPNQRQGNAASVAIDPTHPLTPTFIRESKRHWLSTLHQRRLPLDATWPGDLAMAPNGRSLLVSDSQGGIYSVFPIASDGSLQPLEHVLKLTGGATDTARPGGLLFHPSGRLAYGTDRGTHRLHVISFDHPQPTISAHLDFVPGSFPTHLVLHPSRRFLLVAHRSGVLSVVPIAPTSGDLLGSAAHYRVVASGGVETLVLTPAGDRVYVITRQKAGKGYSRPGFTWAVHTCRLSRAGLPVQLHRTPVPHLWTITRATLHDGRLILIGERGIVSFTLDPRTGLPFEPRHVATGGSYTSIVFRPT